MTQVSGSSTSPVLSGRELAYQTPAGLAMLDSGGSWRLAPHLALLTDLLLSVVAGERPRLIVTMPPRHGKSTLISKYFPAWHLGRFPDRNVLLASYEATFAASWGRGARAVIEACGQDVFGVRVDRSSYKSYWWQIEGHGGAMYSYGVRGPLTGKGADIAIIDDPIKNDQEANSQVVRDQVFEWYRSTLRTRLDRPEAGIVLLMTRWHEDDLAGRLIDQEGGAWEVFNLPALCDAPDDPLGREPGEPLWPERFPAAQLATTRAEVGSYWWGAMYQGSPHPEEGAIFERGWFPRYRIDGQQLRFGDGASTVGLDALFVYLTVDLAASEKEEADYTAITAWARYGKLRFLLDVVRERIPGHRLIPEMQRVREKWGAAVVAIEKAGMQLAIIDIARKSGLPVREVQADRDKVSRALAATPICERGGVLLPEDAAWLSDFESELYSFPRARHDDQVDAFVYGVLFARGSSTPPLVSGSATRGRVGIDRILGVSRPEGF